MCVGREAVRLWAIEAGNAPMGQGHHFVWRDLLDRNATSVLFDFLPVSGLALQKEGLWVFTLAAKLKRSKVLVPRSFRNNRRVFAPLLQGEKIFHRNAAFFGTGKEMLAKLIWQVIPLDLRH